MRETQASSCTLAQEPPLRILLADDDKVIQIVVRRLLARLGCSIDCVDNGREVLEAVARRDYDVVLMDVQMPELDGLEATRHLVRNLPDGQRPRIIAVTGNDTPEHRDLCLAAGMDDFLPKPVRAEDLVDALHRCRPVDAPAMATADGGSHRHRIAC